MRVSYKSVVTLRDGLSLGREREGLMGVWCGVRKRVGGEVVCK